MPKTEKIVLMGAKLQNRCKPSAISRVSAIDIARYIKCGLDRADGHTDGKSNQVENL